MASKSGGTSGGRSVAIKRLDGRLGKLDKQIADVRALGPRFPGTPTFERFNSLQSQAKAAVAELNRLLGS